MTLTGADRNVSGHTCSLERASNGEVVATCECGARWTYKSSATDSELRDIYKSHLDYFDKPPTIIL
jgi:hypothetical protein